MNHVRIWLVSSALDSVESLGLHIPQSSLVDANDCPCFQLSGWLVTALLSVFVAYGHVTRL